jgi:hypothetical protein
MSYSPLNARVLKGFQKQFSRWRKREQVLLALREGAPIGQFLSPVKKNALVTWKWTTCADAAA